MTINLEDFVSPQFYPECYIGQPPTYSFPLPLSAEVARLLCAQVPSAETLLRNCDYGEKWEHRLTKIRLFPALRDLMSLYRPSAIISVESKFWLECVINSDNFDNKMIRPSIVVPFEMPTFEELVPEQPEVWKSKNPEFAELVCFLSGIREEHPPSGGTFMNPGAVNVLTAPYVERYFSPFQLPPEWDPALMLFGSKGTDVILASLAMKFAWWRVDCREMIYLADGLGEFVERLVSSFRTSRRDNHGDREVWPWDSYSRF